MTLRERIADWISGGALSRALEREEFSVCALEMGLDAATGSLRAILTETDRDPSRPSVKRIARIAKGALE